MPGIVLPSPNFGSEKLTAYELGYRDELLPRLSFSASLYYNVYGDLRSEQGTPVTIVPIVLVNGAKEDTYGAEIWGSYGLTDWWRLNAGFNWLDKDFRNKPGFMDLGKARRAAGSGTRPRLRSQMNLYGNWEFDSGFALRRQGDAGNAQPPCPNLAGARLYRGGCAPGLACLAQTEVDFSAPTCCMTGILRPTIPPTPPNIFRVPL